MKILELVPIKSAKSATPPSEIHDAVSSLSDLIPSEYRDDIPAYLEKILLASTLGGFTMSNQQYTSLTELFNKKVAPAPRQLDINQKVSVEHVIKSYLDKNGDNMYSALLTLPSLLEEERRLTNMIEAEFKEVDDE